MSEIKNVKVLHLRCGIFSDEVEQILKKSEILYDRVGYKGSIWIRIKNDLFAGSKDTYTISQINSLGERTVEINKSLVYMFAIFDVKARSVNE